MPARATKHHLTELRELREAVEAFMRRRYPKADAINGRMYGGRWYVEVWKDGEAFTDKNVPDEALL